MDILFSFQDALSLVTLSGLEIILGIDNVIFIALIIHHLPPQKRNKARIVGLSLALVLRIIMLLGASWVIKLTTPLFTLYSFPFSGRNLLLIIGGLFLIIKGGLELIELFNEKPADASTEHQTESYAKIITQIVFIDLILSFDSIITAVGMTSNISIIIIAIFIAMLLMLVSSKAIGEFIYENPSIKVLALFFIGLVGVMLVINGFGYDFPKAYIYVALFFSLTTEMTNIMLAKKRKDVNR